MPLNEVIFMMSGDMQKRMALARHLVEEGCVKKYVIYRTPEEGYFAVITRYVVVGERSEYLVGWDVEMGRSVCCTCKDYLVNVLFGDLTACKHMLAVELAVKEEKTDVFYLTPDEYRQIRNGFLNLDV